MTPEKFSSSSTSYGDLVSRPGVQKILNEDKNLLNRLEARINDQRSELEGRMASIDALQKNFHNLASLANSGKSEATDAQQELESTKTKLADAEAKIAALESSLSALTRQLETANRAKAELEGEVSLVSEVQEELSRAKDEIKRLKVEIAENQKQLTEGRRMIGSLEQKFAGCLKERQAAEIRCKEQEAIANAARAEASTNEREMWTQKSRAQDGEKEIDALKLQLAEEKRRVKESQDENSKLTGRLEDAMAKDKQMVLEASAMKERLGTLEGQLSAKAGLESLVEECQQLQAQLREAQGKAEKMVEDHEAALSTQSEMHGHEVRQLVESHGVQVGQLDATLLQVRKDLEESAFELNKVKEQCQVSQQEIDALQEKLKACEEREGDAKKANSRLQRTLEEIQKELFECKEERNKAEAEALEAEERARELERRLEAEAGGETLKKALEAAEARHADTIAKLRKDLEVERKKLENVQAEYIECKKERNTAEHEALEAEEQLRELEAKYSAATAT